MATMNSGLGGPAGYGENIFSSSPKALGNIDDGAVEVDVTSVFTGGLDFFGTNYTEIYINSNGAITFGTATSSLNSTGFNQFSVPTLLPFYSDIDVSAGGEIYWDFDATNGNITITWDAVFAYGDTAPNSFQVVLSDLGDGEFGVEYIYESILWAVVPGSGTIAVAGFTDGGPTDYALEGSGNETFMRGYESNDFDNGDPSGTWIFSTFEGTPDVLGVNGTAGSDAMPSGYIDSDGDQSGTGDDLIFGRDGADTISADAGADTVVGGAGADDLSGNSGADLIYGGDDDDTLEGDGDADTLNGGTGDDLLTGGSGNDVFEYAPGDGDDTITDFNSGNTGALGDGNTSNNDFIDLAGYYDSLVELRADFDDDGFLNQTAGGDYTDNTQFQVGDKLTFTGATRQSFRPDNTGVVCFAAGTMILTPGGEVPVELLKPGDLVCTRDNGPKPVLLSSYRRLGPQDLAQSPKLRPVLIQPGAFGQSRALIVSPQHGMLLTQGTEPVLVRATHLAELKGGAVRIMAGCRSVIYWHLLFEDHQIVFSNGLASESCYPGAHARRALTPAVRAELNALFPDLARPTSQDPVEAVYGPAARDYSCRANLPADLAGFVTG
ncbi:MAG: Hint domain-containing protein [Paracoccaceae bacterium]